MYNYNNQILKSKNRFSRNLNNIYQIKHYCLQADTAIHCLKDNIQIIYDAFKIFSLGDSIHSYFKFLINAVLIACVI